MSTSSPSSSPSKKMLLLTMAFALLSASFRSRNGSMVAAFHLATTSLTTKSSAAAARTFGSFGNGGKPRHAFSAFQRTAAASSVKNNNSMKLQMSTLAAPDLKQSMGLEHPAYEVLSTDFVEEYGTATTLYRHKKSGAELLSVSSDDDNKVFGITFRTPRKCSSHGFHEVAQV